jgi:hypothetical protein
MKAAALTDVQAIVDRGGDADDVLRAVVAALVGTGGCAWAGILFREEGELLLGPQAGTPAPGDRVQVPVVFDGNTVAQLVVDGCSDRAAAERVAGLIAAHCLVGWDTGGVAWEAVS